jgi:putative drug exporter of the RND superfamily
MAGRFRRPDDAEGREAAQAGGNGSRPSGGERADARAPERGAGRLARFAVRRPRAALALWLTVFGLLGLAGIGVEERLHRTTLQVDDTGSERADELTTERFGDSHALTVALRGPRAAIDRDGRALARRLDRVPRVTVLSPWTPGAGRAARPSADRALLVLRVARPFDETSRDVVPQIRDMVEHAERGPLEAHVTGFPDISAGIERETLDALKRAEIVAAPLLMVILLLVFRSVVAASLPLVLGLTTIGAARGLIGFSGEVVDLDAVALNLASMMGLALGIDYSLLIVSRFREELANGRSPAAAALVASRTAGRTVKFAGIALVGAMLASYLVSPANVLGSSVFGVTVAGALSVVGAIGALPAALVLLGERVNKLSFGRGAGQGGRWGGFAWRVLRRPLVASAVVLGVLVLLTLPALALDTGPPDPRMLPADNRERQDFQGVRETFGGGWVIPYEVIFATDRGAVTERRRLAALDRWQRELIRDPDVVAVLGPSEIGRATRELRTLPRALREASGALASGKRGQDRLADGLERAGTGVDRLRAGLEQAAAGAGRLEAGGGEAQRGADALAAGLSTAREGAAQLIDGLERAAAGAADLERGSGAALRGARRLEAGLARARRATSASLPDVRALAAALEQGAGALGQLQEPVGIAASELGEAFDALERALPTTQADPAYAQALESVGRAYGAVTGRHPRTDEPVEPGYDGLSAALTQAQQGASRAAGGVREIAARTTELVGGLTRLERGADRLGDGLGDLARGARELDRGLARLVAGGGEMRGGLVRLGEGSSELALGIGRLAGGAGELEDGLSGGSGRVRALDQGIDRMQNGVAAFRRRLDGLGGGLDRTERLQGTFESGYFTLAALDGAAPAARDGASFIVNVDRGGDAARVIVVQRNPQLTEADLPLRRRLDAGAERVANEIGGEAAVGGPIARLQDFDSKTTDHFPWLVLALCSITYLALLPILRSVLMPAVAILLNVLTVAAAVGVLVLLFQGDDPLLGGPGFLDAIIVLGIAAVMFGLSIDYEVFLLARMREGWAATRSTDEAIEYGLRHTAGIITGGALIMCAVFVAFSISDIAGMRQYGVGLTVAVILDATIVRLVLLPAAIRLLGDAAWWMPAWLERLLPGVDVDEPSGQRPDEADTLPLERRELATERS